MYKPTSQKRELFARTLKGLSLRVFAFVLVMGTLAGITSVIHPSSADASAANTINFQARLENASGSIAPDGTYNVEFKLYSSPTGGSALWTEDYLVSNAQGIQVANGYLTTNLGSITAFPGSIDWSQQLYVTMDIGGTGTTPSWDGEMVNGSGNRMALTAVPYAFAAQNLVNNSGSYSSSLKLPSATGGAQTFQLQDQEAPGTYNICIQGTAACGFAPTTGGSGYIQNQNTGAQASSNFWISGTGKADTFNATTALQTGGVTRIDGSGNLTNIGNISGTGTLQLSGTSGTSYVMSALGLGTTSPQAGSALTVANGNWISGVDSTGAGYVNMFQVNSNNEIQVGAALNVDGGIVLPTDGGQLTFSDLPIDSSASAGTAESYTLRVGSTNALTVYGQSDGAGGTQNVRVAVGSSIAPAYTLDVGGDSNVSGSIRQGGNVVINSSGTLQSASAVGAYGSITGVGTITTGTWNGTAIAAAYGGTGQTSYAVGDLLYASAATTLSKLSDVATGSCLVSGGVGVAPLWGSCSGGGSYINLQSSTPGSAQTGNFNITGTGIAGILQAATFDTATAAALNIGTTNATAINLNQNTTIASGKTLTVNGNTHINVQAGSVPGLIIQANNSQSGDFFQILGSDGSTVIDKFDSNGNLTVSGGGTVTATLLQGGTLDTASAGTLNIGTTNATAINLAKNTTVASGKTFYIGGSPPNTTQAFILPSSSSTRGLIIQGVSGQSVDLLDFYSSANTFVSGFDANGNLFMNGQATFGTTSAAGTINLKDGTASNYKATLKATALSTNQTLTLPDETGTLCVRSSTNCGFAPTTNGTGYIQNQNASAQTGASFFIQPSSGKVGGVIKANGADTLDIQDSSGNAVAGFDQYGSLFAQSIGANQGITDNVYSSSSNALAVTQNNSGATVPVAIFKEGATPGANADIIQLQNSTGTVLDKFDSSGNLTVNGGGKITGTTLRGSTFDTASAGTLSIGTTNANAISLAQNTSLASGKTLTVNGATAVQTASSVAFQVQDGSSNSLLTADTGSEQVLLGKSAALGGKLAFANASNANLVSIVAGVTTGSYTLTLPTAVGASGQCLQATDGAGTLGWGTCNGTGGTVTLQNVYDNSTSPATITTSSGGKGIQIAAGAAPTTNILDISNSSYAATTANANGLHVNYVGGAAAVEAAGMRIDYAPGGTSGGTWSGLRIVANATGAASGVNSYGIKLEGPSSSGGGTNTAVKIASGWDIGMDIGSGGLQLSAMTDPSSPAANTLRVYARAIAGRTMLKVEDSTGGSYALQPSFAQRHIEMISMNGTNASGNCFSNTSNSLSQGATNNQTCALNFIPGFGAEETAGTVTSGTNYAGAVSQNPSFMRGSTSGDAGGFFFEARVYFPDASYTNTGSGTGDRIFVGLTDRGGIAALNSDDPTGNRAGFSFINEYGGRTDTTWQITTKDGTTENLTNTSMAFTAGHGYDMYLYSPPDGSTIYWRIDDITQGSNSTQEGTVSTNLPSATTALGPDFIIGDANTTHVVRSIGVQHVYVESKQ